MNMFFLFLLVGALNVDCMAELLSPDQARVYFLSQQVHDPANPVFSYNLGIAALQQKKYSDAERHFSLATELYDRSDKSIIPAYFSWADTAALQLIDALRDQKELKGAALDAAIARATDASNRYASVLVFDAEHAPAQERKKVVDRLKQLLEARKQEEKEEEKHKDQQKNQQQDQQKNDEQNSSNQSDDEQQQDGDQNQDKQNKDAGQESSNKKNNNEQKKQSSDQQKKPKNDTSDDEQSQSPEEQQQNEKSSSDEEKEQLDQEKDAAEKNKSDQQNDTKSGENDRDSAAGNAEKNDQEQEAAGSPLEEQAQDKEAEGAEQPVVAPAKQYDANTEMAKKRAMVLLDKLQNNEAALQKAQLLKKSGQQGVGHERYNQW